MTITSVVYVPEGIAMAADSRLTGFISRENGIDRFPLSDNAQKLSLLREGTIGVSFSGDAIIENKTVADFLRVFEISYVDKNDTVRCIAEKLKNYLKKDYEEYDIHFILAGYDEEEQFVFEVWANGADRININKDNQLMASANWLGEIEPVSKIFEDTLFNFLLMPLKDAVDLAEFIVELSIKYERFADKIPTCGGPIDILVITKDYTQFYRHKTLKP